MSLYVFGFVGEHETLTKVRSWLISSLCRWNLRGRPDGDAPSFVETHMYCIVLATRPHGSWKRSAWKRTFLKLGLRVEKSENTCWRRISILSGMMTPSPHPSTSSLRPLNPVASRNNNNNNGGLHACDPIFWNLLTRIWISSTTYRPAVWTTIIFSGSVWTQIFYEAAEDGGKKIVFICVERP